ncbi:hypothetical protein IAU60_003000 [Kwoniella sp. DSM 27419]
MVQAVLRPLIWTASLILVISVLYPRLRIVQNLLIAPILVSGTCFIVILSVIFSAIRRERDGSSSPALPTSRIKHALRPLRFTTAAAWSATLTRQSWEDRPFPFAPLHTSTTLELNERINGFLLLVRRHFILPWYSRISPSPAFPHAAEALIRQVLSDLVSRADDVDWPNVLVARIIPLVRDHLQHYRSVEHLSSISAAPSASAALPLPLPLKAHSALSSQPHVMAGTSPSIESHLRQILARTLQQGMPEKSQSAIVLELIREILLGSALLPLFEMLCDADFWNRQIDDKGGRYLLEQRQVDKFLSALSTLPAPASSSANPSPLASSKTHRGLKTPVTGSSTYISVESSSKHIEKFLKSIGKLGSLGEARRLRADVERELRSAKLAAVEKHSNKDTLKDAEKDTHRVDKYVGRLERARVAIDARIAMLSGRPGKTAAIDGDTPADNTAQEVSSLESISLYAVLADPSSLAYWLEHMERRGRSRLVQYWLTIEGFKDPLEAAGLDSALESSVQPSSQAAVSDTQTIGDDVAFLYETYFSVDQNEVDVPVKDREVIAEAARRGAATTIPSEAQRIKHAVFSSQRAVYDQMEEEDWPAFKKGELFIKALTDLRRLTVPSPAMPAQPQFQSVTSPVLPATPLPRPPIRTSSAFADSSKSLLKLLSPTTKPRASTQAGSFSPRQPVTPIACVSITPPLLFQRNSTDSNLPLIRDLRTVSSGDVDKSSTAESSGPVTPPANVRRSSHLDFLIGGEGKEESTDRERLFGDDDNDETAEDNVQLQRMEAIQAALSEIIASDDLATSRTLEPGSKPHSPKEPKSPSASLTTFDRVPKADAVGRKMASRSEDDLKGRALSRHSQSAPPTRMPSVTVTKAPQPQRQFSESRTSLSPEKQHRQIFEDEPEDVDEASPEHEDHEGDDVVQLAAPGDMQLSVEIARLQDKIQELAQQDHLLDTLIRQAELTGNQVELKILRRSQSSVRREQRTAIFQKAQFEQQEEENRLVPGRTKVAIPSYVITSDEGESGKQVVKYTIQVRQTGDDGQALLGWEVARRYNEFWELDRSLKEWASSKSDRLEQLDELKGRMAELPGKKLVPNLSASFVESRRAGLERYLQSLLQSTIICDHPVFRAFLSRSAQSGKCSIDPMTSSTASLSSLAPHNIVKSLYKTMATSIDDALLGPSMLDVMYTSLSRQLNDFGGLVGIGGEDLAGLLPSALKGGAYAPYWLKNDPTATATVGVTGSTGAIRPMGGESGMTSFTTPICDLFIEVFDLKENNWLRRQAIVVILQQFLGSTIERKVRDSFRQGTSSAAFEKMIASLEETLFPGGERRPPSEARTEQDKIETKIRAYRKLGMLIPDVAANMIGRSNARRAAQRVFGALQDTRLNQHLILSILDEVMAAVFPPVK